MAPVLSKLTQAECLAEDCALGELGPLMAILRPHCNDDAQTLIITCDMQRNDAQISWTQSYIDIPNQCSPTPVKRENGKGVQVNLSLGGCTPWELRAAILNTSIKAIANSEGGIMMDYIDEPGKKPQYYEASLFPYDGAEPSNEVAIVLPYAMLMSESIQESYGISTPREIAVSIYGERHPTMGSRARLYRDKTTVTRLLAKQGV